MSIEEKIRTLTLGIKAATVEMRWGMALRELERHYRSDQPRVPAGTREGGRWTDDGRSGVQRQDAALAGRLIDQRFGIGGNGKLIRMCTYFDLF